MKLGNGATALNSRSAIRLLCVATLVLSGLVSRASLLVASGNSVADSIDDSSHAHHHYHHHQLQQQQQQQHHHHRHGALETDAAPATGQKTSSGHKARRDSIRRKNGHHHCRVKKLAQIRSQWKKQIDKGTKEKCDEEDNDKNKERPMTASFGILICDNKTISAVYCPTGTKPRPGVQQQAVLDQDLYNEPSTIGQNWLSATHHRGKDHGRHLHRGRKGHKHTGKHHGRHNRKCRDKSDEKCRERQHRKHGHRKHKKNRGRRVAYLDIIPMDPPCPKPVKEDIGRAIKQLTTRDLELLKPFFNLNFNSQTAAKESLSELTMSAQNNQGQCKGVWDDKCTSIGVFCGIDIFGCNTIDDGLYKVATNGTSSCRRGECECSGSGSTCGSNFPPSCRFEPDTLYFCKAANSTPVAVRKCPAGCPKGAVICNPDIPEECRCKNIGTICGSTYPKKCGYESDSLYACKIEHEKPVIIEKCKSGICKVGDTTCTDNSECECKKDGKICGSSFNGKCLYKNDWLYDCKTGATPIPLFECKSKSCLPNDNKCAEDPCACKTTGAICGSTFPENCGLKKDWLYQCVAEDRPTPLNECKSKSCPPNANKCAEDPCACKTNGAICGSTFPESCGLKKDWLYQCVAEEHPTPLNECTSKSCPPNANKCDKDPCACKTNGKICGSTFPSNCGFKTDWLYECVADKRPVPLFECKSKSCSGTQCDEDPCACKSNGTICGSTFPESCGLKKGWLYDCVRDNHPTPLFECKSKSCMAGATKCDEDPCACKSNGTICGSTFPENCGLKKDWLYQCVKEDRPTPLNECKSKSCPPDAEKCDEDPCSCKKTGTICGATFPDDCGLKKDWLYECEAGENPVPIEECTSKSCPSGSNKCTEDPCACKSTGQICGSSFPDACLFKSDWLYECIDKQRPTPLDECKSKSCPPNATKCDLDPCSCTTNGAICGSTFPDSCNLKKDWLYECVPGNDPVSIEECTSKSCPSGSNKCTEDPCACKSTGQICGSSFPDSCMLKTDWLYECEEKKRPTPLLECPSKSCPAGANQCDPDPCICKKDQTQICGSTFPSQCNLHNSSLYLCSGEGTSPAEIKECTSGECPPGSDKCTPGPCECSGTGKFCGSSFPETCQLDSGSVYECTEAGIPPKLYQNCTSRVCNKDTGECTVDECLCKAAGDICGSDFPERCGYDPNTLHRCDEAGGKPVVVQNCRAGCPKGTNKCADDSCLCKSVGKICGSTYPEQCQYKSNTVYDCLEDGGIPVAREDCGKKVCPPNGTECVIPPCTCTLTGTTICGSSFDESCGFEKGTLYTCVDIGDKPLVNRRCASGECRPNENNCVPGPCECTSIGRICGSTFPAECRLNPNALYVCVAISGTPTLFENCKSNSCTKGNNKCDTDHCVCSGNGTVCGVDYPEQCGLEIDSLYRCVKGQKPEKVAKCKPGTCLSMSGKCDEIDNDCLCKKEGDTCGSNFPPKCKYLKEAIYKCSDAGELPKQTSYCPSGSCPAGSDECAPIDRCDCDKLGKICGSTFDKTCGFISEALYECKVIGDPPEIIETCKSKKCLSGESECGEIDPCSCSVTGQICGSAFDPSCNYNPDALYYCADEGDAPKLIEVCSANKCPKDGNACLPDPCLCTRSGQICGSTFPNGCKLEQNALYFCKGPSSKPEFISNCPSKDCKPNATQCTPLPDKCVCEKTQQICGSTFDPSCNLEQNSLYYCAGKDEKPKKIQECIHGSCPSGGTACERNKCLCTGTGKPCGSEFPSECNLDPDTKYNCANDGSTPEVIKQYPPGQCPDQKDPCLCRSNSTLCGTTLVQSNCSKDDTNTNAIYRCVVDELPVLVSDCSETATCQEDSSGAVCKEDPCKCTENTRACGSSVDVSCGLDSDSSYTCNQGSFQLDKTCDQGCNERTGNCFEPCECKGNGPVCASRFPDCGLDSRALYTCATGDKPVLSVDCRPANCEPASASPSAFHNAAFSAVKYDDKCSDNPCHCGPNDKLFCGSEFPADCRYPNNTVYSCSAVDSHPTVIATCDPQTCIPSNGDASCSIDPCACTNDNTTVCSSDFPRSCRLNTDSVYSCLRKGDKPVLVQDCKPEKCSKTEAGSARCDKNPCLCNEQKDRLCGTDFPARCGYGNSSIYRCPGINERPVAVDQCPETLHCAYEQGSATCHNELCHCTKDNIGVKVCGDELYRPCEYENETIYTCNTEGDEWEPVRDCAPGKCANITPDEPVCTFEQCICKPGDNGKQFCDSNFPPECNLTKNTVYACSDDSELPSKVVECGLDRCVRNSVSGTAVCERDVCACLGGEYTLCGKQFPAECGLKPEAIYRCDGRGSDPVLIEECEKECYHEFADHVSRCIPGPCDCPPVTEPTDFCGANFFGCGLRPNKLFTCVETGKPPFLKEDCEGEGGACAVLANLTGRCVPLNCECQSGKDFMCGIEFPLPHCQVELNSLYSCEDPKNPVIVERCLGECDPFQASSFCKKDPCWCRANTTRMCGSEFDMSCSKQYDANSVYDCTNPTNPVLIEDCDPGTCVISSPAHCFIPDCSCKEGMTKVCGNQFPKECNLATNSVYECTGVEKPELIQGCDPHECAMINNIGQCKIDECLCQEGTVTACGSQFPESCGYSRNLTVVYQCDKPGDKPVAITDCTTQCEVSSSDGQARCKPDPCLCGKAYAGKNVCASQFPADCGYPSDKLYSCDKETDRPAEVSDCSPPSTCKVDLGVGSCVTPVDLCKCPPNRDTICGSQFPESCGYEKQTVYNCRGMDAQDPIRVVSCEPRACLPGSLTATCEPDPCLCKTTDSAICGLDFDSTCGYDTSTLYECPKVGEVPTGSTQCPFGCIKGSNKCSEPPPDPCNCNKAELICGSAFPMTCRYDTDMLYECSGKGVKPVEKEKCIPGGCVTGTTTCAPDPCKCGNALMTCGSDYLDSCNLSKDKIYSCSGKGAIPRPAKDCEPGHCESVDGTAVCKPNCNCLNDQDTCGIDFDPGCNLNNDTLYTCSGPGAKPVAKEQCNSGACRSGTHECYKDPCACVKVGDICGKDICPGLTADTVYTCTAIGTTPTSKTNCPKGQCNGGKCEPVECVCTEDGPFCGNELPCPGLNPEGYYSCSKGMKPFIFGRCNEGNIPANGDCLCVDTNTICSTYFPPQCGYDQSQVMGCPGGRGTKPVTREQCGVGRCTNQIRCDKSCLCADGNMKCGKQFDPTCGYDPGTLYSCSGAGATPQVSKYCGPADLCATPSFIGRCITECQCRDVDPACGAVFPKKCGFDATRVYRCDYTGATPASGRTCALPCNPQHGPDKCGMTL
ncbi:hypothetical protein BGW38_004250 [Lunasporangiospora selenospora]|uniref:Uncharacterized protein n=1 Tax=Lunasporangiospora selenospora TaxID=979761 RepID=A0A9P6G0W5_9FUNG|nr:hypothetical protein BGW38_004250 [Lunasporangiospora selenospora]